MVGAVALVALVACVACVIVLGLVPRVFSLGMTGVIRVGYVTCGGTVGVVR